MADVRAPLLAWMRFALQANKTFGYSLSVAGSSTMSGPAYDAARRKASQDVGTALRLMREDPRAKKDPQARRILGHEEVLQSVSKTWLSEQPRCESCSWCELQCTGRCGRGGSLPCLSYDT